jgi:hypothetical protein
MSEHNQVEQQLAIYRELSAAERQAVDRHVQNCAACARTQAVYQAMDGALVRLPMPVPDAGLRPGFYAALAGAQPPQPLLTLVMGRLPALAAQMVLLAVLLVLGWTIWQGAEEWMAQPVETAVTPTEVPDAPALTDQIYITLQDVRYSSEATVIDVTVHTDARWVPDVPTASPPLGLMARDMQLTDSVGREYPGLGVLGGLATVDPTNGSGLFDLSLQFGPIAPNAGQLALAFNLEFTNLPAAEVLTIALDGRQPGDTWTEAQAITFAGLPLDVDYALTPHAGGPADALLLALHVAPPDWPDIRLLCLTLYGSSQALDLTNQCADSDGSISHHYALNEGLPDEPVRLFMSGSLYLEPAWQLTWAVPESAVSTESAVSATPTLLATTPTEAMPQTQTIDGVSITLLDVVYGDDEMVIEAALGRPERVATVRLFDDKNRPYSTTQTPRAEYQPETGQALLTLRFPPVAADAQQLTLQLSLEISREADRTLLLDLNGRQWGDVWPLDETVQLGDWPVRLTQARLAPPSQEAVGPPSAFARLEITVEPILVPGVSLGCLFIRWENSTGPGSGCSSGPEQIIAYLDLPDGLPTQPQPLTIEGALYLDGPWQFTWALPDATAVSPTATPDTADLLPQPLTPIFTAPDIRLWSRIWMMDDRQWATNSDWFGFGVIGEEQEDDRAFLGHIHFLNLHSQEVCPFPHHQGHHQGDMMQMVGWAEDDTAVLYNAQQPIGAGWQGIPCTDTWQPVADITDLYLPPHLQLYSLISPDETYRIEALVTEEGQGNIWINLSLIEQASGLAVNNFTYLHEGSRPNSFPNVWYLRENPGAGRWLDDETFLVNMTLDQGPLLLTTGGEVINLARDLFDVPERIGQQGEFLLWAEAVYQADTDTFDFLLSANFNVNAAPPALLYHGDSGIVEQLPAEASQFVFSANGRWLAVYPQPAMTTSSQVRYDRWLRPVKPAGNENYYLLPDEAHRHRHLDANWERLAVVDSAAGRVTIQTIPDETPLAIWTTADYTLHNTAAWSPNGRFLLLSGTHKESGEDGLFMLVVR